LTTEDNTQQIASSLVSYGNDFNSLNLRLNPDPIIERIKYFLMGTKQELYADNNGIVQTRIVQWGKPKANIYGIQSILTWLSMIINVQVVQGNFHSDKQGWSFTYENYLYRMQISFGDYLMINLYEFGIEETEYNGIIDGIMCLVEPYISRLIDNKERQSYGQTFEKSGIQSNTVKSGGIQFFKSKQAS